MQRYADTTPFEDLAMTSLQNLIQFLKSTAAPSPTQSNTPSTNEERNLADEFESRMSEAGQGQPPRGPVSPLSVRSIVDDSMARQFFTSNALTDVPAPSGNAQPSTAPETILSVEHAQQEAEQLTGTAQRLGWTSPLLQAGQPISLTENGGPPSPARARYSDALRTFGEDVGDIIQRDDSPAVTQLRIDLRKAQFIEETTSLLKEIAQQERPCVLPTNIATLQQVAVDLANGKVPQQGITLEGQLYAADSTTSSVQFTLTPSKLTSLLEHLPARPPQEGGIVEQLKYQDSVNNTLLEAASSALRQAGNDFVAMRAHELERAQRSENFRAAFAQAIGSTALNQALQERG